MLQVLGKVEENFEIIHMIIFVNSRTIPSHPFILKRSYAIALGIY